MLKTSPASLVEKCGHVTAELKALSSELESMKSKAAKDALGDVMNQVKEIQGVKLLAASVEGVDMNGLRDLGDQLKEKLGDGVVVLLSNLDGKVNMVAMAPTERLQRAPMQEISLRELPRWSAAAAADVPIWLRREARIPQVFPELSRRPQEYWRVSSLKGLMRERKRHE